MTIKTWGTMGNRSSVERNKDSCGEFEIHFVVINNQCLHRELNRHHLKNRLEHIFMHAASSVDRLL